MLKVLGSRKCFLLSRPHLTTRISMQATPYSTGTNSASYVEIGDVKVPINNPKNPELVPHGNLHFWGNSLDNAPQEVLGHLRWMAQKSLLGQDIFLTGPPSSNRRRLILSLAELCGWECEYLMITKDTTEADLKQRREIVGDSVVWCDSAPVRAAINGRILIIDGMENAERNVLPTINNLLENREMMLEDGRFLMKGDTIKQLQQSDKAGESTDLALSARLIPVHPSFRVVALGLPVPPYQGRVLDPPSRSRFQSRFINELSLSDALDCVNTAGLTASGTANNGASESLKAVAGVYEALRSMRGEAIKDGSGAAAVPSFSMDGLRHSLNLLRASPPVSVANALSRSIPLGYAWRPSADLGMEVPVSMGSALSQKHKTVLQALMEKIRALPVPAGATAKVDGGHKDKKGRNHVLTSHQQRVLDEVTQDLSLGRNVCMLGGKGSGKSYILQKLAANVEQDMLVFPVYQEMSGRDLLQRRGTTTDAATQGGGELSASTNVGVNASSLWLDSPLIKAARAGRLCVLDGVDRIDPQALLAIRTLISSPTYFPAEPSFGLTAGVEAREVDLPSGERLQVHENFRLIALGGPPTKSEDARVRYLNSDLNLSFHLLPDVTPSDIERVLRNHTAAANATAMPDKKTAEVLSQVDNQLMIAIRSLYQNSGKNHLELRPSLRHAQRVQATLRTMLCNNSHSAETVSKEEIGALVHSMLSQALLVRFLSAASAAQFEDAMESVGLGPAKSHKSGKFFKFLKKETNAQRADRSISIDSAKHTVTIGNITVDRRTCELPELVPQPLFHANASHLQVLESLLLSYKASYETDEKAILLIGNQGVGKNKLVDRLLQVLNAEREYIQLHRDTTIQSLTLIPLLEQGQLTYQDSPLVRAAQTGRILVCDEVDKAPLEVICMLKGLIGDGELVLHDGRRLLSMVRAQAEYEHALKINQQSGSAEVSAFDAFCSANQIVPMHPDFRIFVLANRPGHPFQGNAFFRECGDLFSCHVIENLDVQSEVALLSAFAPNVDTKTIGRIAETFADLRGLNDSGVLNYPFSAREAVAIVKHLQAYPQDQVEMAVEDILGFDGMNPQVRTVIAEVFRKRGFHITAEAPNVTTAGVAVPLRIKGGRGREEQARGSTPRTNSNMPKHGKHDADNKPHVGGEIFYPLKQTKLFRPFRKWPTLKLFITYIFQVTPGRAAVEDPTRLVSEAAVALTVCRTLATILCTRSPTQTRRPCPVRVVRRQRRWPSRPSRSVCETSQWAKTTMQSTSSTAATSPCRWRN